MSYLIAIIHEHDVYMAAPKSHTGYSHIIKKKKYLWGVINSDKALFEIHLQTPNINNSLDLKTISNMRPNLPQGDFDLFIAEKDGIFHLDGNGVIHVSTTYKVIGEDSDIMYGALYASRTFSPEDRIKIALEAAGKINYEIVRV
jgi:hypothetical protein